MNRPPALLSLLAFALSAPAIYGAIYEVGAGKRLSAIGDVPWEELRPGDRVEIAWRPEPYREKWVICRAGTAEAPIVVHGVLGPKGERPVIDGENAVTRPALKYWGEQRGLLKIGGATVPADTTPKHIVIENLDFKSARTPYQFTGNAGTRVAYAANAAAIYVEKAEDLTIRNCILRDSGNGLFISSNPKQVSRKILIEGNQIHDNGIEKSLYEHNSYTAAVDITFHGNRFGPLRKDCPGNNLKDRSAGLVVRYNWIQAGNRQLDLVDAEDSPLILNDPRYQQTFVYGNVLLEPDGAGNRQIIHYGGDSGKTAIYRKGTLYFYHNTVVSLRRDRTVLIRPSSGEQKVDARNNILLVPGLGRTLGILEADGAATLSHNWIKAGWSSSFGGRPTIADDGTNLSGEAPGFRDLAAWDFGLAAGSPCLDAGGELPAATAAHRVEACFVHPAGTKPRQDAGRPDLGAFSP